MGFPRSCSAFRTFRAAGLGLALGLAAAPALFADNDWLDLETPRPFDAGIVGVSERVSVAEYDGWQDGGTFSPLVNDDGNEDIEDLLILDTRVDWRLSPRLSLELDAPLVFNELSPYTEGVPQYYNVGTPGVYETQGLGDLGLELRGDFAAKPVARGWDGGWTLELVAPTGLGPFAAPQTLDATGAGRWQVLPGLVFGGQSGAWEGWVQARGRVQFGQQAQVSPDSYVDWNSTYNGVTVTTDNTALPGAGGGLWLAPRYGADAVAGLSLIWYRSGDTKMGLGCEAAAHWLSPWATAAGPSGLPAEQSFVLTPEVQARYGPYSVVAGWQAEYLWAVEEPWTDTGTVIFDVAYTF